MTRIDAKTASCSMVPRFRNTEMNILNDEISVNLKSWPECQAKDQLLELCSL